MESFQNVEILPLRVDAPSKRNEAEEKGTLSSFSTRVFLEKKSLHGPFSPCPCTWLAVVVFFPIARPCWGFTMTPVDSPWHDPLTAS
jgi:hypothetical protein